MKIVYLDIFLDTLPAHLPNWEVHSRITQSHLKKGNTKKHFDDVYILVREEWGKGGREHLGMKAQLWTPKNPNSQAKNIIVFRGTSLGRSVQSIKKNLGDGLRMDFDQDGIGKSGFNDFKPVFRDWLDLTRSQQRGLILTGHSLGGALAMRLHAYALQYDSYWALQQVESMVFNSPGLDSETASYLNGIEHHFHIRNHGRFYLCCLSY